MRWSISAALLTAASLACAGPAEFGTAELNSALAARNLKWRVRAELSLDPPESFRIDPAYGGASISGGDLRGLMYGLLDAADQIRATGHIAKTRGNPATPLRGARIAVTPELESAGADYWRGYFQMLARNRFNRVHVAIARLDPPYALPRLLSEFANEYSIDFTLGLEAGIAPDQLTKLLAACAMIHSIAVEAGSESRDAILAALRDTGRRVTVDFDGSAAILTSPSADAVPIVRPFGAWPPSFEIAAPLRAGFPEEHALFYWIAGRLSYDPKTKLPKTADPDEYAAAREAALDLAAADQSRFGGSEYVASPSEAVHNQLNRIASAKLTPLDLADRLESVAAKLDSSSSADFHYIAQLAAQRARTLRVSYARAQSGDDEAASESLDAAASISIAHQTAPAAKPQASPKASPRPALSLKAPDSAPADHPLTLSVHLGSPKDASLVRLHYRLLDPSAEEITVEAQPGSEVSFTIPAAKLTGNWDLQYYFEILSRVAGGWFEPDPFLAAPLPIVHIVAPRSGPN